MIAAITQTCRDLPASPAVASHTPSDELLVGRIARGDRLAMRMLFARHQVRVFRFVLRVVRDETLAEDLVSDVFLDVWRQAGEFAARAAVSTWLLAIARYKAISALRRRTEVALDDNLAANIVDPSDGPEDTLQDKDRIETLHRCLAKLSPEHAQIIDLVYYHGKSVKEVAEVVGIPQPTVKTRMFYARKRLAGLVEAA
jgi:RNA polymerase sigma-70 factor (ECF subfamily)